SYQGLRAPDAGHPAAHAWFTCTAARPPAEVRMIVPVMMHRLGVVSIVALAFSAAACAAREATPVAAVRDPFAGGGPPAEFHGVDASSRYIALRDGVRVAIDVLLPRGLDPAHRVPALFKISRFGRARADGSVSDDDRFWVEHGFARVLIDQRGTGASF